MNTLVSSKVSEGLHVNFARDKKYSWIHAHTKIEYIAYIYFFIINV